MPKSIIQNGCGNKPLTFLLNKPILDKVISDKSKDNQYEKKDKIVENVPIWNQDF